MQVRQVEWLARTARTPMSYVGPPNISIFFLNSNNVLNCMSVFNETLPEDNLPEEDCYKSWN